jgi:hypothetical protein
MKPRKNSRKSPLDSGYPNTRFDDSSHHNQKRRGYKGTDS